MDALKNKSFLIIEDDDHLRRLMCTILESAGGFPQAAARGGEAVILFKQAKEAGRPFDAVLLDLYLEGGGSGVEVLEQLRAIEPGVTAVIASGRSADELQAVRRRLGAAGALAKPFNIRSLTEAVAQALAKP